MTDNDVINYLNNKYQKRSKHWTNLPQEIKEYLETRYSQFNSYAETVYRILHNINEIPICPVCGKTRKFIDSHKGYGSIYCSMKCQWTTRKRATPDVHKQFKDLYFNNTIYTTKEQLNDKIICDYIEYLQTIQSKVVWTKLEKCVGDYLDTRFNDSESRKESWFRIKNKIEIRPTCIYCGNPVSFKYVNGEYTFLRHCSNNKCVMNDPETLRKVRENSKKKWGVDYPFMSAEVKAKCICKNTNIPVWSSKQEIEFKDRLLTVYPDTIWQYKEERYPYFCDFYIPSLDLFIELNYFWKHGNHEFNQNNPEDIKLLEIYIEKAKYDDEYKTAIERWTLSDKEKIKTAIDNKLNYKIFWNKQDGDAWLDSIGA